MTKLMISISDGNFQLISLEAKNRGITVQELIRAVILPDWIMASDIRSLPRGGNPLKPTPAGRRENEIQPVVTRHCSQKSFVGKRDKPAWFPSYVMR